jgi:hypothetical protein
MRPHQVQALALLKQFIRGGEGRPLLQAPTGMRCRQIIGQMPARYGPCTSLARMPFPVTPCGRTEAFSAARTMYCPDQTTLYGLAKRR